MSAEPQTNPIAPPPGQDKSQRIDGFALQNLVEAGLTWLRTNQQLVNSLNVFPVPDGDTGTNMVLTMQAALDEINNHPNSNFGKIAHAVAHGALMGARGNSGVILSQLLRGFARGVDDIEFLDLHTLVQAFALARDTAYKGVVRPVEGTILTVAKDMAAAAQQISEETDDPLEILEYIVEIGDQSVQRTPDLLAVLKEAGVVDAGGKGLYFILEGMLRYARGQQLDSALTTVQPLGAMHLETTLEAIEAGQDYEVVVDFCPTGTLDLEGFYNRLEEMGTSIQLGEGDGIYRLHIHVPTEKLYEPIEYTRSIGTVSKAAIENLIAQMEAIKASQGISKLTLAPVDPDQIAVVAVAPGAGIARVFASLGVAAIVEGGQTMNPSTQEIINAFENLPTDKVVILPNNKNIILAAESAAELTVKQVAVVPSRTVPQGLAATLRLAPHGDFDSVVADMTAALEEVETGEITTATRSVDIDGVTVQEGQTIALLNGKLVISASSLEEACLGLLENAHADHFELITLFYGADLPKSEVNRIVDVIRKRYSDQEVEVQDGDQPHYQFIISIE
jgi:DAK2 domain fusion protein YloV